MATRNEARERRLEIALYAAKDRRQNAKRRIKQANAGIDALIPKLQKRAGRVAEIAATVANNEDLFSGLCALESAIEQLTETREQLFERDKELDSQRREKAHAENRISYNRKGLDQLESVRVAVRKMDKLRADDFAAQAAEEQARTN